MAVPPLPPRTDATQQDPSVGPPAGPGSQADPDDLEDLKRSLSAIATQVQHEVACDGLGITVHLGDDLVFGHSNAFTRDVDVVQYGLMEGPCLLARSTGSQVRSVGIGAGEPRWPRFTPRAADVGLRSVASAPLLDGDTTSGSLNLYGRTGGRFAGLRPAALTVFAERVEQAVRRPVLLAVACANARWFARAVGERGEVDRAVGVLKDRYGLDTAEALTLVQQLAHEDGVSEIVAARTVIDQDGA